jgi:divalent metal cation (Fe/Co/Zn/Cd) transporter
VVAITFFLLAIYITWEAVNSLLNCEEPLTSPVGIGLAVLSLVWQQMISYLLRGNVMGVIADRVGPTRPAQVELVNPDR